MKITDKEVKYYLNKNGEFVIENYNFAKPFANFFPGIAGKYGIPMWTFYVNRGQCISSFGVKDKDHSILEFFPANKAWQFVSTLGFRTFIKLTSVKKTFFYEPFHNGFTNLGFNLINRIYINSSDLSLEEENLTLGIKVKVEYFNIPNDNYAGLARIVTIQNLEPSQKKIQLLDGLPQIVPYGTSNLFLKKLGRTIEAWMNVENLKNRVPFYKLAVDPVDRPEVTHIKEGNFYLGFYHTQDKPKIITPIINPDYIFGAVTDFSCPRLFLKSDKFKPPQTQTVNSRTPAAFLNLDFKLGAKEEKVFYSVIGNMRDLKTLNNTIPKITASGYLARKKEENRNIIRELQSDIDTHSSRKEFDLYAKQTYLDNIIRGGYPITFKSNTSSTVFYLYSRKHGDLERDYNKFQLQPVYLSQGNGNYRDMNQNQRSDIWFNPDIADESIINFLSLIQTDGFNPLVIKGANFTLTDEGQFRKSLKNIAEEKYTEKIMDYLKKPFTPGEIIFFIEENKIRLKVSYDEFLNILLGSSLKHQEAEHGEGFWTDHWTYNLDLLENFLGIYPEKLKEIAFEKRVFTFYDNTEIVKPRKEKYILKDELIKQLHSIAPDGSKRELIRKRSSQPHLVRTQYGLGEIYQTTLFNKLLCLLANKLASLDPFGIGIEMEANKPNWFDALNGLPALFGSSLCETFELKRLILSLRYILDNYEQDKIKVTEEIYKFLNNLNNLIKDCRNASSGDRDYKYWNDSYALKEDYRLKTKLGLSGNELEVEVSDLSAIFENALEKVSSGIAKALDKEKNIFPSYFFYKVTEHQVIKDNFIRPIKFKQVKLPLFLEGQMHALRLSENIQEAALLHKATRKSALFDKELKMYKVTAPLKSMPEEIGRCRVFAPGWLENESIWLHMEYKYILELLKSGLYEEFYQDFKNVLIPFQKPERYGRSILENSSFLVSSAFNDKKLHGNGFVARLSGSTAEFLEIWLIMNLGLEPFFLNSNNELSLRFAPILSGWLFDQKGIYSFKFLKTINVIYHNLKRKNTFGKNPAVIKKILFNDKNNLLVELTGNTIPAPFAEQIRSRQINKIDIYLG